MNTKFLFTCILMIFCTCIKSNDVGKLSENDKEIRLYANRSTFLYGTKATRIIGELKKQGGDNFEWKGNGEMGWVISVPKAEKYDLYLIADIPVESKNIEILFSSGSNSYKFTINPTSGPWIGDGKNFQRIKVLSGVLLPKGNQEVGLKSSGLVTGKTLLNIRAVELVPVSAYKSIEKENKNESQKCKILSSRSILHWVNWTTSTDHER